MKLFSNPRQNSRESILIECFNKCSSEPCLWCCPQPWCMGSGYTRLMSVRPIRAKETTSRVQLITHRPAGNLLVFGHRAGDAAKPFHCERFEEGSLISPLAINKSPAALTPVYVSAWLDDLPNNRLPPRGRLTAESHLIGRVLLTTVPVTAQLFILIEKWYKIIFPSPVTFTAAVERTAVGRSWPATP